jgi:hypothetical protein
LMFLIVSCCCRCRISFVPCRCRLGFEPTLQLKGWNLRTLQNGSHGTIQPWTLIVCLLKIPPTIEYLWVFSYGHLRLGNGFLKPVNGIK